ncbi:MAG TPA: lipopolysaccharide transport periplasmic protein LptA [Steroidobacteraceae bacterium]|jgi:lipopolysaccharide transport protein LptA|nr:lipopolysaccharide transport periplasmic protein LptA [Steroidobacteraceae bacterium]
MAPSRSKLHLLYLAPALAAAIPHVAVTSAAVAAYGVRPAALQLLPVDAKAKINVDAASSDVDGKTNTIVFKNIVVSQGATRVRADHARATGLNFQNSRWTFQGNVQIDAPPRGSLHSDQATVQFRDNQIADATITGSPAQFEQQRADDLGIEKGHADQIVYDVSQGTVLLTDDAWISDGRNEMSAPSIAYSIRDQKVLATSSGARQGVHITITPQAAAKPTGGPAQAKRATVPPKASGTPRQSAHPAGPGASAPPPPGAP